MDRSPVRQRRPRAFVPAALTLALWRLRVTWRLLAVTGIGLIAAIMLGVSAPLFTHIALTAGIRDAFANQPANNVLAVTSQPSTIDGAAITSAGTAIDQVMQHYLGPELTGPATRFIATPQIPLALPRAPSKPSGSAVAFIGLNPADVAPHLTVRSGALPAAPTVAPQGSLQIALTSQEAQQLGVTTGSTLMLDLSFGQTASQKPLALPLLVTGIFDVTSSGDPFWHGQSPFSAQSFNQGAIYPVLADADSLIQALAQASVASQGTGFILPPPQITWYYTLQLGVIDSNHIPDLIAAINQASNAIPGALSAINGFSGGELTGAANDLLQTYTRVIVFAQVPVDIIVIQVLALVLFFVALMADLLIEWQSDAIATLRSRGASAGQIFGALSVQGIALTIIALFCGPFLGMVVARGVATSLLVPADQPAIATVLRDPLAVVWDLRWYAVVTAGVAMIALIVALRRATRLDALAIRREAARSGRQPVWQRLRLDLVFAVVAAVGYGLYSYVLSSGALVPTIRTLLSPLALIAPCFILVAAALVVMRVVPGMLNIGARLAARGRGATVSLALDQTARAPLPAIRMTLLLALALGFTLFALIFSASQTARIKDATDFAVGADIQGTIQTTSAVNVSALTANIPGVLASAAGYQATLQDGSNSQGITYATSLMAVDPASFSQVVRWSTTYSDEPIAVIMNDLAQRAATTTADQPIPAYVDDAEWQTLHLAMNLPPAGPVPLASGAPFTLNLPGSSEVLRFIAVGRVHVIPTIYDVAATDPTAVGFGVSGGILVDYHTLNAVYARNTAGTGPSGQATGLPGAALVPNTLWLRTVDDPATRAAIHTTLLTSAVPVSALVDRRDLLATAQRNPFQLNMFGVLALGAATVLTLAIIANLVAAWLQARKRIANFAVLRALGAAPGQIAAVLFVEQALVFALAIVLGVIMAAILSAAVLPVMVFTNILSARGSSGLNDFFLGQNIPPIRLVVPYPALGAVIGGMIVLSIVALALMTMITVRPAIGQTLRINED